MPKDPEDPRSDDDMVEEEKATMLWRMERPNSTATDWKNLAPTPKQLAFLAKHGHSPLPTTRGDATLVIRHIIAVEKNDKAQTAHARALLGEPLPRPERKKRWRRRFWSDS